MSEPLYTVDEIKTLVDEVTDEIAEAFQAVMAELHPLVSRPIVERMKQEMAKRGFTE